MSEDWLDTEPEKHLPVPAEVPSDYSERLLLADSCWQQLSLPQRTFLSALRDNRFRVRKTAQLLGHSTHSSHTKWMQDREYSTVFRIWLANAGSDALNKDRLLARQDDIVEELLEPKPILYQGNDTGHKETQAAGAAKANETLMRAAGLLKDEKIDVNVGIAGPALTIMVQSPSGEISQLGLDGAQLPVIEAEVVEEDWLES